MTERPPDISQGLGRLTPRLWRRLMDGLVRFENLYPFLRQLRQRGLQEPEPGGFPALILGYQAIPGATNRWLYAWVEARLNPVTGQYEPYPPGRSSEDDGGDPFALPAYNRIETGNNGLGIESGGVNVEGADYPATWYLQPIRGGAAAAPMDPGVEQVWTWPDAPAVWIDLERNVSNQPTPVFQLMNLHDGVCLP